MFGQFPIGLLQTLFSLKPLTKDLVEKFWKGVSSKFWFLGLQREGNFIENSALNILW